MSNIAKILSLVLLVGALVGGVYLVSTNQQLQRGATAAETSSSILPNMVNTDVGQSFVVHVWINTGKETDKLQGAEFRVNYDGAKLIYTGIETQSGFNLVNDVATVEQTEANGHSYLDIKVINMGTEPGGAVDVAKLNFVGKANGTVVMAVQQGKIMISQQTATWDVINNNIGNVYVGVTTPTASVTVIKPTDKVDGKRTDPKKVDLNKTPIKVEKPKADKKNNPKPTAGGTCGKRCNDDTACGSGQTCTPIWWSCPAAIPKELDKKIKENKEVDKATVDKMVTVCPATEKVVPTGYKTKLTTKLPTFYGVCRTTTCPNSPDCGCGVATTLTPTSAPTTGTSVFSDDFSSSTLDSTRWWTWINGLGTAELTGGQINFILPAATDSISKSVAVGPNSYSLTGDFVSEVTLKSLSVESGKSAGNLNMTFSNSDWTRAIEIMKATDASSLVMVWYDVGATTWMSIGSTDNVDLTMPVRVKIERIGTTLKVSYDLLGGSGYKLLKQLDNYYYYFPEHKV